jgi:hypothetical protein
MSGESRKLLVGSGGAPGVLQLIMQHICARMLSGVPAAARAASQQPGIEQLCSVECPAAAGTPAKTLLLTAAKRTKDMKSRFTIIGYDDSNESRRCLSRRQTTG